jgi:hypothetical protein
VPSCQLANIAMPLRPPAGVAALPFLKPHARLLIAACSQAGYTTPLLSSALANSMAYGAIISIRLWPRSP